MTKYGFPEFAYVIPNKAAYMDDETWSKVVKVVAPGIQKMAARNVAFLSILFSTYQTLHLCPYKLSADDLLPPIVLAFITYDGFKYHVDDTEGLETFAEDRIMVGREETRKSALNQAYYKFQ